MSDLLQDEILSAIDWLRELSKDLYSGKAKEVPPSFGHVLAHPIFLQGLKATLEPQLQTPTMVQVEKCVDFLKLHGYWFYIAICPRTGIRFVEWKR
jgi:hypothetical protein